MHWNIEEATLTQHETQSEIYDSMDGPSEEEAYLQGNKLFL